MIILDCCYVDGKIVFEYVKDDNFFVYKFFILVEFMQYFLEFLYNNFQKIVSYEDFVELVLVVLEEFFQIGFDILDGNVFIKVLLVRFTIRQWFFFLSYEEFYVKGKGSFFIYFMVCGLRGVFKCQFLNCFFCKRFKVKVKFLGYIFVVNLEDFVLNYVEIVVREVGGRY